MEKRLTQEEEMHENKKRKRIIEACDEIKQNTEVDEMPLEAGPVQCY